MIFELSGIIMLLLAILSRANLQNFNSFCAVDNVTQMTVHKIADEERQKIKLMFLDLLNLPHRPMKLTRSALLARQSMLEFLLSIHQDMFLYDRKKISKDDSKLDTTAKFELTDQNVRVIDTSNVIRAFSLYYSRYNWRNWRRIWFDVSKVPTDERIVAADLRVYCEAESDAAARKRVFYIISVYHKMYAKDGRRRTWVHISSVKMTAGWIVLNVTQAIEYWMNYPKENYGFLIVARCFGYFGKKIVRHHNIDIRMTGNPDKQPFVIGFFDNARNSETSRMNNGKRSKRDLAKYHSSKMKLYAKKTCHMYSYYVSFKELRWDDWLIAPNGYDGRICIGMCDFPFNSYINTTSHSIIQALLHLMNPKIMPNPSCAPTSLSPLSIIYIQDNGQIVLKTFNDMMVESCGCL